MGSILERKDGRCVVQWIDGSGRQRQETLPRTGKDGQPLTAAGLRKEARRRLQEYEAKALRQQHGLDPLPSESLDRTFGELRSWWWEQHGKTLRSPTVRGFLEKHLAHTLDPLAARGDHGARAQAPRRQV